jgi:hypothetical protein
MVAMGLVLLIDSRVSGHVRYATQGVDPFLVAENPRGAFERYLGLALLFVGFWLFRQSKSNSEDNGEDGN